MPSTFYTSVSDIALCQKCPALLAYKLHKGEKGVWKIGIKGNGFHYGTLFHKNISQVFFEGASNSNSELHAEIAASLQGGAESLEAVVRRNIFMPFIASHGEEFTAGQIFALARGVTVWVRAMWDFFSGIPSLLRSPEINMHTVFIPPEQKLKARFKLPDGSGLVVNGCYDALMFNPDRAEARLFEFKGYMKSDIAVPLSQSLIYSWLIYRHTGIVPSVEIIYLDEYAKEPDIFAPSAVTEMIKAGLPGLFMSVFSVMAMKKPPEFVRSGKLCSCCKFKLKCEDDWGKMI